MGHGAAAPDGVLLGEAVELAEEILRLPEAGPYGVADRQRIGLEIYDVLWNTCAVARSTGVDVVQAAAEKRRINQMRAWPRPQETPRNKPSYP